MKNDYQIQDNDVIIYLKRRDGSFLETIIDLNDLDIVNNFEGTWYAKQTARKGPFYVLGNIKTIENKYTTIGLHRYLMKPSDGLLVDHINHDTLDNRRCNLRLATQSENQQNIKGYRSNSLTKVLGVSYQKNRNKWLARIQVNKKDIILGLFSNVKDAEQAVINARKKYMPFSKEAFLNQERLFN